MSRFARILIRETTELTIRLGTCAASSITPSTRKRTWKPSVSGSKWTSDAPCSTAWAMIERTSLIVGASSADSRSSTRSSAVGWSSSWTASSTAPSRLDMRPTAVRMSSREATTGIIERPVIIARSSIASTFDGFAIATRSCPPSAKPIGSTSSRRATAPSTMLTATASTWWLRISTYSRPKRSATACPSCSGVRWPRSTRTCPSCLPSSRPATAAASTASRGAKPCSTITSPISLPGRGRQLSCGAGVTAVVAAAEDGGGGPMDPISANGPNVLVPNRVRARGLGVVALRADVACERAARVLSGGERLDRGREVVARRPAELLARQRAVVDALDAVEHPPAAPRVDLLVARHAEADDRGRSKSQLRAVGRGKRRRRADDVAAEPQLGRALDRQAVRADDILEVDPAVQELVDLQVQVLVGGAHVVAVVALGEEARRAQDQDRQAMVTVDELAEVLGRDLRGAVDVTR